MRRVSRQDPPGFWVAVAGAVVAIGGIFVGIGVAEVVADHSARVWSNLWFVVGVAIVAVGALALLTAIVLFARHRGGQPRNPSREPDAAGRKAAHAVRPTAEQDGAAILETATREYLEVALEDVAALYERVTEVQGDALTAPYLGKWVTVSGVVFSVTSTLGFQRVSFLRHDSQLESIWMTFDAERWRSRLLALKQGQPLTVTGRLRSVSRNAASLIDCEVVEP